VSISNSPLEAAVDEVVAFAQDVLNRGTATFAPIERQVRNLFSIDSSESLPKETIAVLIAIGGILGATSAFPTNPVGNLRVYTVASWATAKLMARNQNE
jgi:hypothetical protein